MEAALAARTRADLDGLTADLPAPARPVQKDLVTINQRFGETERKGRWVVPRRMEVKATGFGASVTLVTRPGIVVLTDDLSQRMGDVTVRQPREPQPDVPVILSIELSGRLRGGDILVRPPRRTLGQWARREPPKLTS